MTALLQTHGLTRRFGGVRALGPVDFTGNAGEIHGLIGPNGSGKTTFFNTVTGFLKPDEGSVSWQGQDITRLAPGQRAKLGLVRTFQERMVFAGTSVRENLQFALIQRGAHDLSDRVLLEAMDAAKLPASTLGQLAGNLSWGQCRMLGMVLGLILKPKLLLLDEPFAGLNRVIAAQVSELLSTLRGQGIGAIIVEHDMGLLLPLCDRVTVFASGEVLASGTSDEILTRAEVRAAYFGADIARNS